MLNLRGFKSGEKWIVLAVFELWDYYGVLMKTLDDLQKEAHNTAVEKGWYDTERPFSDIIANLHDEISEAWQAYCVPGNQSTIFEELADCVIRIMDYCEHCGTSLYEEIDKKMQYNKTRSYRHGGKRA